MSDHTHAGHAHGHGVADGFGYGSVQSYLAGLGLAAVLSALAFGFVAMGGVGSIQTTAIMLVAIAIARLLVHMVCFLRVNSRSEEGWTMITTIFTVMVVVIAMIGSIWIMLHGEINMMPMPGTESFRGQ